MPICILYCYVNILNVQDVVKVDAGHVGVEEYIASLSFSSWASFRPQYMVGSGNNKDCEEWFFDRKFSMQCLCMRCECSSHSSRLAPNTQSHIHSFMHVCSMYVGMLACMYVCIHVCLCVCMYHTHTHTQTGGGMCN